MNESAIKTIQAILKRSTDPNLDYILVRAIGDLEEEAEAEEARQKTLCQENGICLTVMPPIYQCRWCNQTWSCCVETPVCTVRIGAEARGERPRYMYGGMRYC